MRLLRFLVLAHAFLFPLTVSAGVIAYWRFEEGADGLGSTGTMPSTANHVVSQVNSPALNGRRSDGAAHYVADTPGPEIDGIGVNNRALYFDGNDAWKVFDNSLLDFGAGTTPGGDFTMELFIKLDTVPNLGRWYRIFQKRPNAIGGDQGYDTFVWAGGDSSSLIGQVSFITKDSNGGFRQPRSHIRVDDSSWHHLAFRRYADAGVVHSEMWVDYVLRDSGSGGSVGSLANSADLYFGRSFGSLWGGNGNFIKGWMDEIRFSNEAIPPEHFLRAVPEPSTALLVGVASLLVLRTRRRT